jgi:hypothetical protein
MTRALGAARPLARPASGPRPPHTWELLRALDGLVGMDDLQARLDRGEAWCDAAIDRCTDDTYTAWQQLRGALYVIGVAAVRASTPWPARAVPASSVAA